MPKNTSNKNNSVSSNNDKQPVVPNTSNIAAQIDSAIKSMTEVSNVLAKGMVKIKVKDLITYKLNFIKFKIGLKQTIDVIKDFSKLLTPKEVQEIMSTLCPDADFQAKLEAAKNAKTPEAAKIISEMKKPTIIDVITSVTTLLGSLANLPVPELGNLITLKTKSFLFFSSMISSIINLMRSLKKKMQKKGLLDEVSILTVELFEKYLEILESIINVSKLSVKSIPVLLIAKLGVRLTFSIAELIIKRMQEMLLLLKGTNIKSIERLKQVMESMESTIRSVLLMCLTLSLILLLAVPALLGLVAVTLIIKSVISVIQLVEKLNKKETKGIKNILIIAGVFLLLATSLYLLSLTVLNPVVLLGLAVFILIIGALVGVLWLISKIEKLIKKGVKLLLSILFSLVMVALTLVVVTSIMSSIEWEPIVILLVTISVMVGLMFVLQLFDKSIKKGVIALMLMSVSFLVVAIFMSMAANTTNNIEWEGLLKLIAVIGTMALAMFGLSFLTPYILGGIVAMGAFMVVAVMLLVITVCLKKVSEEGQDINLDNVINKQGTGLIDQLIGVVNMLYDKLSLKFMAKMAFVMPNLLGLLAIATPIAAIANLLKDLSSLSIPTKFNEKGEAIEYTSMKTSDFEAAKNNALICVDTLIGISNAVTEKMKSVSLISTAKKVIALKMISELVDPISKTANLIRDLASGRYDDYDENGKVVKINLTEYLAKYEKDINNNIQSLLGVLINAVKSVDIDESVLEDNVEILSKLNTVVDPIKGLVDIVKNLHEMTGGENPLDFTKVGQNIINCLSIIDTINAFIKAEEVTEEKSLLGLITYKTTKTFGDIIDEIADELEDLPKLTSSLDDLVKFVTDLNDKMSKFKDDDINKLNDKVSKLLNITTGFTNLKVSVSDFENYQKTNDKFINSNIKFIDKINSIDVNKIRTVSQMFKEMTDFSKSINGNFDKLAEFFNEKLLKALEDLKEVLDKYGNNGGSGSNQPVSTNWMSKDDGVKTDSTPISKPESNNNSNDMKMISTAIENLENVIQEIKNQGIPVYNNIGDALRVTNI